MKIRFWGVRGSIPVPGPQTNRYGGNTSCVEVRPKDGPQIILDAGTGLRRLGKDMMLGAFGEGKGRGHLLISHTHWDHIQGLPFFAPLYQDGNQFFVYARQRDDTHLRLARGGLDKQAAILPLVGRLKMTVLDVQLAPNSIPILAGRPVMDRTPLSIALPARAGNCWTLTEPSRRR